MSSSKLTIALGCDEAAYNLKETVRSYLEKQGHTVKDYGVYNTEPSLYPNIALEVSSAVADGQQNARFLCAARELVWPSPRIRFQGFAPRSVTMFIPLSGLARAMIVR